MEHVKLLDLALSEMQKEETYIFQDPYRICDLDEAVVGAQNGKIVKVLSSKTHHCRSRSDLKGNEKRLMAVLQ